MDMDYIFCFANVGVAKEAQVDRKKIDRGIQVVCKWETPNAPTVTYEARVDFGGEVQYRVKFNATTWASFNSRDRGLVDEFRQALHELDDARFQAEAEDRKTSDEQNRSAALAFFRVNDTEARKLKAS